MLFHTLVSSSSSDDEQPQPAASRKTTIKCFKPPERESQQNSLRGFHFVKTTSLLTEDRSNAYLADQIRRSGIPVRRNSRARSEQEKRKAIKAPVQLAKQSNTQSRETKLDQVRASIVKHSGKNSSS